MTFNSLNVVLPIKITVDITNTYSSVRCGQLLTYNGHSVATSTANNGAYLSSQCSSHVPSQQQ